jgi:predicted ATPase
VLPEVARVLGVDGRGRDLAEVVAEVLRGKRVLLLIDNAEHLLPAAATTIAQLRDIGGPTIVVTSRERLQVAGEHVYSVPPLDEADAVALFIARGRALSQGLEYVPAVEELCARLDYLPLAIELAAARTVVLSPTQIIERFPERLDLLKAERDADPRHRTLRSTIEWSHDLLHADEQELFAHLAVFAGGFTLEAAEQVCGTDLDAIASLVDKTLLRRSRERFLMLETIYEYAAERLDQSGDEEALRRRHAESRRLLSASRPRCFGSGRPGACSKGAAGSNVPSQAGAAHRPSGGKALYGQGTLRSSKETSSARRGCCETRSS